MLKTLEIPLIDLFPKIRAWSRKEGYYLAHVHDTYITTFYTVTDDDLSTIDPRTPHLMDALWRKSNFILDGAFGQYLNHNIVELALDMKTKSFPVKTRNHGEIYMRYVDSADIDPHSATVQLTGGGYRMGKMVVTTLEPEGFVMYPMCKVEHVVPVFLKDMDSDYPGWKERYDTAKLLGYEGLDAGVFIFENTQSSNNSNITGVTFE